MGTTQTWFASRTVKPQNRPIGRQFKDTRAFSGTSLFFGILASAGCAAIIPALGAGRLATVAGAALSPLLVAVITTHGRGLVRGIGIAALSAFALVITIGGFTLPEAIAGHGSLTGAGSGTFVNTERIPAPTPPAPWTSPAVTTTKPPASARTSPPPTPPTAMNVVIPEIRKCPELRVGEAKACKQIGIRNDGSTSVEVATGDIEGDQSSDFTLTRVCDGVLKPNSACSIRLRFWPTAAGAREAFLVVHLQPGNVERRVTITGDALDRGTEPTEPTRTPSPSPSPSEPDPTIRTQHE
ncbi:hypothetical protein ACGFIF_14575 [Kribbella sp. NPDC049174]|uniref:hypothetical protein n=1 Tax=Kribbella sp. NPDC049174 TaxID=3364112 RepID=UPI00372411B3